MWIISLQTFPLNVNLNLYVKDVILQFSCCAHFFIIAKENAVSESNVYDYCLYVHSSV